MEPRAKLRCEILVVVEAFEPWFKSKILVQVILVPDKGKVVPDRLLHGRQWSISRTSIAKQSFGGKMTR